MTAINSYVTLAELKAYITARGQPAIATDTVDDIVLDNLLEGASRAIDGATNRHFYPTVETRWYSVPEPTDSELMLDEDLLAITTLTNGDSDTIGSTDYNLLPRNFYPKYSIKIKDSSDLFWEWDSDGNDEGVISVLGLWGYNSEYLTRPAWVAGSTLSEDLDASELGWDVTSALLFSVGQIVKVDNELAIISSIASNTLTIIQRAANGSTAATHTSGATVYYWVPQRDIWQACIEIANNARSRRLGQNLSGATTITPSGLVIAPHDWTETARKTVEKYVRLL